MWACSFPCCKGFNDKLNFFIRYRTIHISYFFSILVVYIFEGVFHFIYVVNFIGQMVFIMFNFFLIVTRILGEIHSLIPDIGHCFAFSLFSCSVGTEVYQFLIF